MAATADRQLTDEFLLLILDDVRGRPVVDRTRLHAAVSAAALVELTLAGALEVEAGPIRQARFRRTSAAPPADPILAEICAVADGKKPKNAVSAIGVSTFRNRARRLADQRLARLVADGLLERVKQRVLGLFPRTAFLPGNGHLETRVRDRVRTALTTPAEQDVRTAAVVSLLAGLRATHKVFPELDRRSVTRRAKEISEADWAGPAVKQSLDAVYAALGAAAAAGGAAGSS